MNPRVGTLYLVAAVLAFLALAFGAWDVWIKRDGGASLVREILVPAIMFVVMIALFRRSQSSAPPQP